MHRRLKQALWIGLILMTGAFSFGGPAFAAGRPATQAELGRFAHAFQLWKKAWLEKDVNVLKNTFGYTDPQIKNAPDPSLLHYSEYQLISAIALEDKGEKKFTLYYEVSLSANPEQKHLMFMNGSDQASREEPLIGSCQLFPSTENPAIYTHEKLVQEVKKWIRMSLNG